MEKEIQEPDFWDDKKRAASVNQELSDLKEEVEGLEEIKKELSEIKELSDISEEDDLFSEMEEKISSLEKRIRKEEFKTFLSGKYDRKNAILQILSGAGGIDAQDWATILLRMYQRYCQRKGFSFEVIDQSFGEGGGPDGRIGTKSATIKIKGSYAYGLFKKESGVHRLVRISPFSAKSLRHTSFTLVEVLPVIGKEEVEVKPEDLKVDTFRASGPGGQYVNKRESAIRITHIPTGVVVSSQAERLQGKNREKAMEVLYSKLYKLEEEKKEKELKKVKGGNVSVSWGNQIRSYVFHPYQMVKDLRTDVETSSVEDVLDGDLDQFILSEVKLNDKD